MTSHTLFVEGLGFWAPTLPGWDHARLAFRGEQAPLARPTPIPKPTALPNAERRRAPDTVSLALAVSAAAMQASGREPAELMAVFTSAHGDLPTIDHLCTTLAQSPLMVSPTRFLHTIHNAPLGVWSLLWGNGRNHNVVSAAEFSFAAGLLEAAMLAQTSQQAVLLVGYDTAATGALVNTTHSEGAIGVGLVLHARASAQSRTRIDWCLCANPGVACEPQTTAARSLPTNGMSQALPLYEMLALGQSRELSLPLSAYQRLQLALHPLKSGAEA
ncbi:MAG: beta-ketoacyl synthase chain length factor [Burkholderiaceae bacterium]